TVIQSLLFDQTIWLKCSEMRFRLQQGPEPRLKDQIKFGIAERADGATERALTRSTVRSLQLFLKVLLPLAKRHCSIEFQELRDEGVEMIRSSGIGRDAVELGYCKICLPPTAARQVTRTAARLVVDDPVAQRCFDLTPIRSRKLILFFREVVTGWIRLGREDSFHHRTIPHDAMPCS